VIEKEKGSRKCYVTRRAFIGQLCLDSSKFWICTKGELVGPGNFGNQDTLVANTQGSSSLYYYWPSRHEGFSTTEWRL